MKWLCCSLALLSLSALALSDAKSELQAKYNELAKAFADQNTAPFDKDLDTGYVLHVGTDTKNRDYVLKDFAKQMKAMRNVKWDRRVLSVQGPDTATVATVKSIFVGDFTPPGGKVTHFWNSAVSKDTWTHSSGGWMLESSTLVTLDAKLNGKPAGHFPPSGKH